MDGLISKVLLHIFTHSYTEVVFTADTAWFLWKFSTSFWLRERESNVRVTLAGRVEVSAYSNQRQKCHSSTAAHLSLPGIKRIKYQESFLWKAPTEWYNGTRKPSSGQAIRKQGALKEKEPNHHLSEGRNWVKISFGHVNFKPMVRHPEGCQRDRPKHKIGWKETS